MIDYKDCMSVQMLNAFVAEKKPKRVINIETLKDNPRYDFRLWYEV